MAKNPENDFEKLSDGGSFWGECWGFLKNNKKFWLLPIIIVFALLGGLIMLGSTAAAPFIYTLF